MSKALAISRRGRFVGLDELTARVDRAALLQFKIALYRRWPESLRSDHVGGFVAATVMITLLAVTLVGVPAGALFDVAWGVSQWSWIEAMPWAIAGVVVSLLLGIPIGRWAERYLRRDFAGRGGWRHWYRLTRVASRNSLAYLPEDRGYHPPGLVLAAQGHGEYRDVFVDGSSPMLQFANFIPGIERSTKAAWSFLSVELGRDAGHLLFIPHRGRVRLGALASGPVLLPPEIRRRGSLYDSEGTTAEPLSIITPELIELLAADLPGAYVETAGNRLTISAPRPWNFDSARAWLVMDDLIEVIPARAATTGESGGKELVPAGLAAFGPRRIQPGFVTPVPRPAFRLSWLAFVGPAVIGLTQLIRVVAQAHPNCGC